MADSKFPMHYYPDFIISPIYKNRCLKILVKENATLQGGTDEFLKVINKTQSEVQEIMDNNANLWKSGRKVSNINETNIDKNTKRITNAETIYAVCLPLPNELMDVQTHRWDVEKGFIGSTLGSATSSLASKIVGNTAAGNASSILAEASSSMGFRKPLVDPGWFQNYSGSTPRNFTFSFDLIPNNSQEAEMILNIVLNLKKFSLPRSTIQGVSLLSPFLFEIEIGNDKIKKLMNMNDVVMTEISVNYSGDGNMQMFANGMPKFIQLNLSFAERSVVTSEFYD